MIVCDCLKICSKYISKQTFVAHNYKFWFFIYFFYRCLLHTQTSISPKGAYTTEDWYPENTKLLYTRILVATQNMGCLYKDFKNIMILVRLLPWCPFSMHIWANTNTSTEKRHLSSVLMDICQYSHACKIILWWKIMSFL